MEEKKKMGWKGMGGISDEVRFVGFLEIVGFVHPQSCLVPSTHFLLNQKVAVIGIQRQVVNCSGARWTL